MFNHTGYQSVVPQCGASERDDKRGCLDKALPRRGYAARAVCGKEAALEEIFKM